MMAKISFTPTVGRLSCLAAIMYALSLSVASSAPAQSQTTGSVPGQSDNATNVSSTSATLEQCLSAVNQANRSATFAGQMVATADTQHMTMRIDVLERMSTENHFHTVSAPGLGVWRNSVPGVKIYRYLKQVTNLSAPASFKARIRFRWLDAKSRVVKRAERRTATCDQPDERPKLVVGEVMVKKSSNSSNADYQITVRNDGRSATDAFQITLNVNGLQQAPVNVAPLAGGSRTQLAVVAPRCTPQSTIEVGLDPQHQIDEAQGGGLSDVVSCPSTGEGSAPQYPSATASSFLIGGPYS
jgi:CARDB